MIRIRKNCINVGKFQFRRGAVYSAIQLESNAWNFGFNKFKTPFYKVYRLCWLKSKKFIHYLQIGIRRSANDSDKLYGLKADVCIIDENRGDM